MGLWALLPATAGAVTYSTPGSYTLVVPSGVSEMTITATGGGGGGDAPDAYPGGCFEGKGGLETASFPVSAGATLDITVAGKGGDGGTASETAGAAGGTGGVGGGGAGGDVGPAGDNAVVAGYGGGGGGGASTVSVGGNPLLVAAGGGGCAAPVAASSTSGGNDGSAGSSSDMGGGGAGTLTAGGAGGGVLVGCWGGVPGTSGTAGQGGSGGGGSSVGSGGGGGGAGYYGGGGGGGGLYSSCASGPLSGGGGGGGSDYVASTGCNVASTPGSNRRDGAVTIDFSTGGCSLEVSIAGGPPVVRPDVGKSGEIDFPLTLSSPQSSAVTVDAGTMDGTGDTGAVAGRDYVQTDQTVTFPAGATQETLPVPLIGTVPVAQTETFSVNLSNPSVGTTIGTGSATGTILCSATSASGASLRRATVPHDATSPCQLTLTTAVGNPEQLPGFWYDGTLVGIFDKSGTPQFLQVGAGTAQFAHACEANCTNVAVLVTGWDRQAVPAGTKVIASTFPIAFQPQEAGFGPSPFSVQPPSSHDGYVCEIGGDCGAQVTGTTGSDGIAKFRYFLPGIAGAETVEKGFFYPYPIESLHFVAQAQPSCGCWTGAKGAGTAPPVTLVPHTWVDNTRTVTHEELAGLRAIIEHNAKNKEQLLKRFGYIVKFLKGAKILTDDDIKDFTKIADKTHYVENLEKLLHANRDSVMLGWFMNKFEIADDGLLSLNFDWRAWAKELEPYIVDYVTEKIEERLPFKKLGKLGAKLTKKLQDYIDKKIRELLNATVDKLVGEPFSQQAIQIVDELRKNEARGEAKVTLKLQDIGYCYQQCLLLPFPQAYTWLYMIASGVYPQDRNAGNYFYPPGHEDPINYNPQIWVPAQCKAPFACIRKTATEIKGGG